MQQPAMLRMPIRRVPLAFLRLQVAMRPISSHPRWMTVNGKDYPWCHNDLVWVHFFELLVSSQNDMGWSHLLQECFSHHYQAFKRFSSGHRTGWREQGHFLMIVYVVLMVHPATLCPTSHAYLCMSWAFTTAGHRTLLRVHKTAQYYIFNPTCSTYTTQNIHTGTHVSIHGLPSVNHIHS